MPPPLPPPIMAIIRQHGHPLCALCCEGERVSVIGSVAAAGLAPAPHIMPPPVAVALAGEPVAWPPPHIWALDGTAQASAITVAVNTKAWRMFIPPWKGDYRARAAEGTHKPVRFAKSRQRLQDRVMAVP